MEQANSVQKSKDLFFISRELLWVTELAESKKQTIWRLRRKLSSFMQGKGAFDEDSGFERAR